MQKRLLRFVLSLAIILTMFTLMEGIAYAANSAEEITYDELYQADSLLLSGGNKYTFNNGMKITGDLVIENCEVDVPAGGIEVTSGNISINNAKVTVTRNDTYVYGIYAKKGALAIKDSTVQVILRDRSYTAIDVYTKITAENSSIGIIAYDGNGISCSSGSNSDIIVDNCNLDIYTPEGYGISAYRGSLLMTDSVASLDCGNTGLSCDSELKLKDCITTVAAGKVKALSGGQPDAVFASDTVVIDGGSLTASSKYNNGIFANDDVAISNNTDYVSASGATYGIKAGTEYYKGSITIGNELVMNMPVNGQYNADGGYIEDSEGNPASKVIIKTNGPIKVKKPLYKGDITEDGKTHFMSEFYDLSRMPKDAMYRIQIEGGYALINVNDLYALSGTDPVDDSFTIVLPDGYTFDDGTQELVCTFRILADRKIEVYFENNISTYQYTGKVIKPVINSMCGSDVLQEGIDYDVVYPDGCKNVGSYTVTVNFKGDYNDTVKKTFTIVPAAISSKKATLFKTKYVYTGKALKPAVTISGLKEGTDFTVTYKNNTKVGAATVTIKGKGNYTESKTASFSISPKQAAISKLTAGKKQLTVKMKTKVASTGGTTYQIAYKPKGAKKWKYTTATKQSKVIKRLKKGKTYQVKVRAYKSKNYGAWSKTMTSKKIK